MQLNKALDSQGPHTRAGGAQRNPPFAHPPYRLQPRGDPVPIDSRGDSGVSAGEIKIANLGFTALPLAVTNAGMTSIAAGLPVIAFRLRPESWPGQPTVYGPAR
jgi:hypothetical protein